MFNSAFNAVTVIVVTKDSVHCLERLDTLLRDCANVVISDNGSADGTAGEAKRRWPHAKVLNHGRNLGFGAANNLALAEVTTPFAFLLNPDCILDADSFKSLLDEAERFPDAAILAPQLASPRGELEVNYRWPHILWSPRGEQADGPLCVGFVCGAAMLFRLSRFEGVGFFDEVFFLYYEDDDLCLRLLQAHREIILTPAIRAVHHSRGSVKGGSPWKHEYVRGYHHAQSKLTFMTKYRSEAVAWAARRKLILSTVLALPFRVLAFSPRLIARMWGRLVGVIRWTVDPRIEHER